MEVQETTKSSTELHPQWIKTIALSQVDRPIFVVNAAAVKQSISELRGGIGLPEETYSLSYYTKSGSPEVTRALPPEVSVTVSATDIVETVQRNPGRETALYIGTPNEIDIQRNLITTPGSSYLESQIGELSPEQRIQIRHIVWDGTLPDGYNGDIYTYLRELKPILPRAKFDFRVYPSLFSPKDPAIKQRHGHYRGLDFAKIERLRNLLNPMQHGGVNLYVGNPLTPELLASIGDFLQLPASSIEPEPWSGSQVVLKGKDGESLYFPMPERIAIGGFGGYGEKVPYEELRDFINQIKKHAYYTQVVLDLGTYVVERSSTVIFPKGTSASEIAHLIPDAQNDPSNLFLEKTKRGEPAVIRPVSYAPAMIAGIEVKVV